MLDRNNQAWVRGRAEKSSNQDGFLALIDRVLPVPNRVVRLIFVFKIASIRLNNMIYKVK